MWLGENTLSEPHTFMSEVARGWRGDVLVVACSDWASVVVPGV